MSHAKAEPASIHSPGTPLRAAPQGSLGYEAILDAYREVAETAAGRTDLDSTLKSVVRNASALLDVNRCSLFLRDPQSDLFRGRVAEAADGHDYLRRMLCGVPADRFTQEIVAKQKPVLVRDATHDPRPVRSTMIKLNIREVLGVPMVFEGSVIGLMFMDRVGESRNYSEREQKLAAAYANLAAIAVAQVSGLSELRATVETMQRRILSLRRTAAVSERFSKLMLDDACPASVAELATELTGKPCRVYDESHRQVAAAQAGGGPAPKPWLVDRRAAGSNIILAALVRLAPDEASIVGPFPHSGVLHRSLVAPVMVDGQRWGHVVVVEANSRLTQLDKSVTLAAARSLSIELRMQRRAAATDSEALERMGRDLIEGEGDSAALLRRAAFCGRRIEGRVVVCLVRPRDPHEGAPEPLDVQDRFVTEYGASESVIATRAGGGVVLIVALEDGESAKAASERVSAALAGALAGLDPGLVGAISTVGEDAARLPAVYEASRQVMGCLKGLCPESIRILSAADLGVGRLLLGSTDPATASQFMREAIGPLLDDEQRHADLLQTLDVFLEASRSARETARRLDVHENTIRYRLARISELTGLDLAGNLDHQLTAQVAMLVLRLTRLDQTSAETPPVEAAGDGRARHPVIALRPAPASDQPRSTSRA